MAKLGVREIQSEALRLLQQGGGRLTKHELARYISERNPETNKNTISTQLSDLPKLLPELVKRAGHGVLELLANPSRLESKSEPVPEPSEPVARKTIDPRIYAFANEWRTNSLVHDKSFLQEQVDAWSPQAFEELKVLFIDNFDEGPGSFFDKLEKQLAEASKEATLLAAELLFVYFLCESLTLQETKRRNVNLVLSWGSLQPLDQRHADLFGLGFIRGGQGYNMHYPQLGYLIVFGLTLKALPNNQREAILFDPWELKKFLDGVQAPPEFRRDASQKNIILHMLFPDVFEPIISQDDKRRIASTLDRDANPGEDLDRRLMRVRQNLTPEFGPGFGFYAPPIASLWRSEKEPKKPTNGHAGVFGYGKPAPAIQRQSNASPVDLDDLFLDPQEIQQVLAVWRTKKNLVLQGPPGVGKTFSSRVLAGALLGEEALGRVGTVQFHQSYAYEDFIQGWRPTGDGSFRLVNGHFFTFAQRAAKDPENDYVLVIDEINRGNLSRVFGEVLSLLEMDKRGTELLLTYSDLPFSIPSNLYVLGLMNTADRSLALVDYALRRRFSFFTLRPRFDSPKFEAELSKQGVPALLIAKIRKGMARLNEAIASDERNLGRHYQVGHSFFCPRVEQDDWGAWVANVVKFEIAPLLEEYWFDNPKLVEKHVDELLSDLV